MEISIKRLIHLLKLDFKKIFGDQILKVFGVFLFIYIIGNAINLIIINDNDVDQLYYQFISFLLISSIVIGTLVFIEMKKANERVAYLSLPASLLEKLVSKFTISMIVFPIVMIVMYTIGFYIIKYSTLLFTDKDLVFTYMRSKNTANIKEILHVCFIILSVFAYGSIRYNNTSFVKIIIRLFVMVLIALLISFIFAIILIPPFRAEVFGQPYGSPVLHSNSNINDQHWFPQLAIFSYYYFIIPVFWLMTYFTLKEKEA